MKLKAAVVGVGYLGRFHAQKYKNNADVELVAVSDGREEQASAVAAELGCKVVARPQDLIGQVDLVTIAASTQAHYELGKLFLEAKIPVNLEKPLAATAPQARELVEISERNKTLLCVGHVERFNPAILAFKKELKKPLFLDLVRHTPFRARGADVSVMHDLMIHDLDLLMWLSGSNVKVIKTSGAKVISGTWDAVEAFVELDNGMSARLSASRVSSRPLRSLRALENGRVLYADTGTLELDILDPVSMTAAEPMKLTKSTVEKVDALQSETNAFVSAVLGKAPPVVTGRDGLKALEVVEEIEKILRGRS